MGQNCEIWGEYFDFGVKNYFTIFAPQKKQSDYAEENTRIFSEKEHQHQPVGIRFHFFHGIRQHLYPV